MPLLSIIVPIYNAASTLSATLDSLRKQTFEDVEFILVDDGSTDTSIDICQTYSSEDSRFKVLSQENAGVSVARNNGIAHAKGEFIGFVDSDDTIKPDMYVHLVEAITTNEVDMALGGYEKVLNGDVQSIVTLPYHGVFKNDDVTTVAWSMAFWGGYRKGRRLPTLYGSTWPNLYRQDIIRNNKILFPSGVTIGEDLLFNLQYLKNSSSVVFVNQVLYHYNLGNISATRRVNPQLLNKYLEIVRHERLVLSDKDDMELELNFQRQVLSYSINVIEEQGRLACSYSETGKLISSVCQSKDVHEASRKLLFKSATGKEFLQALLFYTQCTLSLRYWLLR